MFENGIPCANEPTNEWYWPCFSGGEEGRESGIVAEVEAEVKDEDSELVELLEWG